MTVAIVKSAVVVGLALVFTTATCSIAQSKPPQALELAQYCAPPQSWEVPRLFCGHGKNWDLIEFGSGAARMAGYRSALVSAIGA